MLKFLRRVSDNDSSANQVQPPVSPRGFTRKEFLVRYVGNGEPEEPLVRIQAKSNVSKGCSLVVDENCLSVSELNDVVLLRCSGDEIEQCVHHVSGPEKLSNYVTVTVRQKDGVPPLCHVFETCSVKEVSASLKCNSTHFTNQNKLFLGAEHKYSSCPKL